MPWPISWRGFGPTTWEPGAPSARRWRADSIGIGSDSVVAVPGLAGGDHRGLRPDPDAMAQRSGVWSALRRNADSGTPGPALGRGVPGQLRRSVSSTSGAGGPGVIRRFHDPAVNPGNLVPAQDYVRDNSTAMIDGLVQMIQSVGGQKTAAEAITIALTSAQPANANEAAEANLMLTQAHGGIAINPVPAVGAVALAVRALNYAEREVTTRGALKQDIRKVKIGTEVQFRRWPRRIGRGGEHQYPRRHACGSGKRIPESQAGTRGGLQPAPHAGHPAHPGVGERRRDRCESDPRNPNCRCLEPSRQGRLREEDHVHLHATEGVDLVLGGRHRRGMLRDPDDADRDRGFRRTSHPRDHHGAHLQRGRAGRTGRGNGIGQEEEGRSGAARPAGAAPDPTSSGGGGHLSFDVGTAFGDANGVVSLELLATTLRELQGNADDLAREFRKDTKGRPLRQRNANNTGDELVPLDSANAPSLATQGVRDHPTHDAMKKYTTLVGRINTAALRGDAVRLSGIHRGLVAFNQTLTNPEVTDVDRKAHVEDPANISHYQAINTEHLADEGGGARIEVRDVPAQTDYAKFLQDLDVLTKALNGARKIVSDAQMVRVT